MFLDLGRGKIYMIAEGDFIGQYKLQVWATESALLSMRPQACEVWAHTLYCLEER